MSVYITSTGKNILNIPEAVSGFDLNTRNQYFATIFGLDAGAANQGLYNTLIGYKAGNKIVSGVNNVMLGANAGLNTLASDNIFIGTNAGISVVNASRNICVGSSSGRMISGNNNVLLGYNNTTTTSGVYNSIALGTNTTCTGNANITIGFQSQMTSTNSILIGSESINQADNSIIIGKNIINSGSNSCIVKCYDDTITYNSNAFYTSINGFLENSYKETTSNTQTDLKGDIINLTGSNISLYGKTFIEEQINVPVANFTSNVQFLKKINMCYSNLNNVHWQIYLDPKSMNMSDLLLKSRNNTFVTFTDDFQSELLNFTGKHRCTSLQDVDTLKTYVGRIVVATGKYKGLDGSHTITYDEAIPYIKICTKRADTRVFGVVSGIEDDSGKRIFKLGHLQFHTPKKQSCDRKVIVNAHGEGAIWICNVGGSLRNGDLIMSSEICGFGMCQNDDIIRSYTVAKITCDCTFDIFSTIYTCRYFSWNGKLYKKALVGCVYKI